MQQKKLTFGLFQSLRSLAIAMGLALLVFTHLSFKISDNVIVTENGDVEASRYLFGIDVSHYQGEIDWSAVKNSPLSIHYVMIRATMGHNGTDSQYHKNWTEAKKHGYVVGAYHYYRPNEHSAHQFRQYVSRVKLDAGDMAPILDIERMGKFGAKNLRKGVLNWLRLAEQEYGKKPIIYTNRHFYNEVLKGHVKGYPLWIADYNGKHQLHSIDWSFHQFTDKFKVKGIRSKVDANDFKGNLDDLKALCL